MIYGTVHPQFIDSLDKKSVSSLLIAAVMTIAMACWAGVASGEANCAELSKCNQGVATDLREDKPFLSSREITHGYPIFLRYFPGGRVVPITGIDYEPSTAFYRAVLEAVIPLYQRNDIPKDTMVIIDHYPGAWLEDKSSISWPEQSIKPDALSPWVWVKASNGDGEPAEIHILRAHLRMAADLWAIKEGKSFSQLDKPFMAYECYWKAIASYMRLNDASGVPFKLWSAQAACLAEPLKEPFHYIMTISPGPGITPFSQDVSKTMDRCFDQMEDFYTRLLVEIIPVAMRRATAHHANADAWWVEATNRARSAVSIPSCK